MPRTLTPDDDVDRILVRIARDYVDSDTLPAALLAVAIASEHGNDVAQRRALRELRALLAIDPPRQTSDANDDAVVYRLCSTCQTVHTAANCMETR